MHRSPRRQAGFTLIEISVVVIILATISAMSLFAINQAFDRRYQTQAETLLVWLNQLSEQAALEGVAYGIMDNREQEPGEALQPLAYFRQHWFVTSYPEPFSLDNEARIEWTLFRTLGLDDIDDPLINEQDALIPLVAMLPDGYIEPAAELRLSFASSPLTYIYRWDEQTASMVMLKSAP